VSRALLAVLRLLANVPPAVVALVAVEAVAGTQLAVADPRAAALLWGEADHGERGA
jgi:hypothetical protein